MELKMDLLHKRCYGHTRTVVVAKVKGTDEIIGGYNPLAWDSSCYGEYRWMETKDRFIFSLKMGIFKIQFLAENDQNIEGPHFGFEFCLCSKKSNFNLDNNSFSNLSSNTYESIRTLSNNFSIDNYEMDGNKRSFHFLIKNGNIQNSILSRVKNTKYAIFDICRNDQNIEGPHFGFEFCLCSKKSNFNLDNNSFSNLSSNTYESIRTLSNNFSIDNYEVFKIVRKS
ncbi:hypothetical protein Glove_139g305 [Diversispora epigaea]|uniref:TLDc domain-containing protein n=1 Tax=Diversispora epigaea TaxID=1348612 RepID=A0A397IZW1_9GLOM|nr:hypothetical protein Glove_139g305 [Diversispora epigaea]